MIVVLYFIEGIRYSTYMKYEHPAPVLYRYSSACYLHSLHLLYCTIALFGALLYPLCVASILLLNC
jgi:hypothetical protein